MSQEKTSLDCVSCPNHKCGKIFIRQELVQLGVLLVIPEHEDPSIGALCSGSFEPPIESINVNLPCPRKLRKKL